MGDAALPIQYEPIVEAAYRLFDDGERRWRDVDIAEWLGLEQPRNIRQVIQDNRADLERHGKLHVARAVSGERGPAATEYWLNFKQSMRLCTYSRTPRSADVVTAMVNVFDNVVNGGIATMPRMEIRALEIAADRIVAPILKEQREFHSEALTRMERHEVRLITVEREILDMRKEMGGKRRAFSTETRRRYIGTVEAHYNGYCPCCRAVQVVRDGKLLPGAEFDHWHHPSKNKAHQGWITCEQCNQRLISDSEFKSAKYGAFHSFHDALAAYDGQIRAQSSLFE